jgi:hypothetical protein
LKDGVGGRWRELRAFWGGKKDEEDRKDEGEKLD